MPAIRMVAKVQSASPAVTLTLPVAVAPYHRLEQTGQPRWHLFGAPKGDQHQRYEQRPGDPHHHHVARNGKVYGNAEKFEGSKVGKFDLTVEEMMRI